MKFNKKLLLYETVPQISTWRIITNKKQYFSVLEYGALDSRFYINKLFIFQLKQVVKKAYELSVCISETFREIKKYKLIVVAWNDLHLYLLITNIWCSRLLDSIGIS